VCSIPLVSCIVKCTLRIFDLGGLRADGARQGELNSWVRIADSPPTPLDFPLYEWESSLHILNYMSSRHQTFDIQQSQGADLAAWLPGGPVGAPVRWAATSKVERGN